tara:strand:+ start:140 stop:715 length:576 start_codon:yes stop_codon:yes gene_type:complete
MILTLKSNSESFGEAVFSSCNLYRFSLTRKIQDDQRTLLFIGLNPSIADDYFNDQTLRKLLKICTLLGYGTLVVLNLFSRVSKAPKQLQLCLDPIGNQNNNFLSFYTFIWSRNYFWDLCFGWGVNGCLYQRDTSVIELLSIYLSARSIFCKDALGPLVFGLTKAGHPRHPLYLPSASVLSSFDWQEKFSCR